MNEKLIDLAKSDTEQNLPMTEHDVELLKNVFTKKLTTSFINHTLESIVLEESQAFFADQKTLEQTIEIIQTRVQTLLNEQM